MPKVDTSKYSPDTIKEMSRTISIDNEPDKSISIYYGTKKKEETNSKAKEINKNNKNLNSVTNSVTNIKAKNPKKESSPKKVKEKELRNNPVTNKNNDIRNNPVTSLPITEPKLRNNSVTPNKSEPIKLRNSSVTPKVSNTDTSRNNPVTDTNSKTNKLRNNSVTPINTKVVPITTPNKTKGTSNSVTNSVTDSVTNSVTVPKQSRNNTESSPTLRNDTVTNSVTITEQLRNSTNRSSVTNSVTINRDLYSITGVPKLILFFLAKLCLEGGSRITPPINFSYLKETLSISSNEVVRVNIYRLIKKGLLRKIEHKSGKGGYQILAIEDHIYKDLIQHMSSMDSVTSSVTTRNSNSVTNQNSSHAHNSVTNSVTHPLSSSSSSFNTNKDTNTNNEDNINDPNQQNIFGLPEEWMSINYERLKDFGFGTTQLKQLYKLEIYTSEDIQEYIDRLDYDIVHNDKSFRSGLLNGFMGILRKGDGYSPPNGYESPMEQSLREELEQKKIHLDRIRNMENELFIISYETWIIEIPVEELEKVDGYVAGMPKFAKEGILKAYFKNNIFKRENHGG